MTIVSTYSHTHSVVYVADNILKSLKDIIRLSGLQPEKFADDWEVNRRGIAAWLESAHLELVILEILGPSCSVWMRRTSISCTRDPKRGARQVESGFEQVDDSAQVAEGAEASGAGNGALDIGIDGLRSSV